MKTYKVWIRACIEQYDDETENYDNVCLNQDGTIAFFYDSDNIEEMCVLQTDDIQEAQEFVDALEGRL